MSTNPDKRINYCFTDDQGVPRIAIVIKWDKGNLYFIDAKQPFKKSYHSPRNGVSQVHIEVNNSKSMLRSFEPPIENIKGFRMMGGSGIQLHRLGELSVAKESKGENYIIDARPFHTSNLAQIQWNHYLVEPGNETDLNELLAKHEENKVGMSERIAIHRLTDSTPWIVTVFTRICDEDPRWYEGL
ncbi:MAG: hypothetical protein Q7S19_02675 [bacterium]|nr:hypothetical protein [bacterium]